MATDSSHMENAQVIYTVCQSLIDVQTTETCRVTDLPWRVPVRKHECQRSASREKVLHFERIEIRIVSWLVVVEHQVDCVCGRSYEYDLEARIPE